MSTVTFILIITLNINTLSALIKRYRMYEWIKKTSICSLQEIQFRPKDTQFVTEGMEKYIPCKQE